MIYYLILQLNILGKFPIFTQAFIHVVVKMCLLVTCVSSFTQCDILYLYSMHTGWFFLCYLMFV